MRILIIEDKEKHILSAEKFAQECEHEVTIARSYAEAEVALCGDDHFGRENPVKNFEVVMTDMFLPTSPIGLGRPQDFMETEQPYGLTLLLLAMKTGVKAVGILTDGNHHQNPMTWALDTLGAYDGPKAFTIGNTTVLCSSNGPTLSREDGNLPEGDPLMYAKNWMKFWQKLMNTRSPLQEL